MVSIQLQWTSNRQMMVYYLDHWNNEASWAPTEPLKSPVYFFLWLTEAVMQGQLMPALSSRQVWYWANRVFTHTCCSIGKMKCIWIVFAHWANTKDKVQKMLWCCQRSGSPGSPCRLLQAQYPPTPTVLLNKWADKDDEVPAMKCWNLWCKMWSDSKAQFLLLASKRPPLSHLPPFSQKSISPLCFQGNRRHVWRDEAVKQQEAEEESQDSWGTFKQTDSQK